MPVPNHTTIAALLSDAQRHGLSRLDAQLLLGELLGRSRTWLLAHDDAIVEPVQTEAYAVWCRRRLAGEPAAYLIGWREFHGRRFQVGPGVLVPRPETEGLVDWALDVLHGWRASRPSPVVVDLGTGSGAIAVSIALAWPRAEVMATDRNGRALAIATANARQLGARIATASGSWWSALPASKRVDLALSNPPYVAADDPHLRALGAEPRSALTPGPTGLEDLRAIVAAAPHRLQPGGWLLLEHGHDQGAAVRHFLLTAGFIQVETRQDLAGLDRCSGGQWPELPPDPTI